jgi:hypothetical protein
MDPTQEEIRQRLHYDPETGVFTRIAAGSKAQARRVGEKPGTLNKANGYVQFHACGRLQYAHRLAWIYVHGPIPDGARIDHANQCRHDNRLSNLRLASHADNLRNCKVRSDNKSGVKGVYFDRSRGNWAVQVANRKLGRFETLEAAVQARRKAAEATFGPFASE